MIYCGSTTCNLTLFNIFSQLTWTGEAASKFVGIGEKDIEQVISYLPLSHIAAQVFYGQINELGLNTNLKCRIDSLWQMSTTTRTIQRTYSEHLHEKQFNHYDLSFVGI